MAASTYQAALLLDLMPALHTYLIVDTASSESIQVGDLVEMKLTDQTVILMDDDQITSGYKFVGISNSVWNSTMIDTALKTTIEVIGYCVVEVTVASAIYQRGEALEYDVSNDDGRLRSYQSTNQLIGWVWECKATAVTKLKALINIFSPDSDFLEPSS